MGDKVLTGEVTHMNVPAGRENRSVMYVPPKVLSRFMTGRAVTLAAVPNIAVQIVQQGAVKSELSLERARRELVRDRATGGWARPEQERHAVRAVVLGPVRTDQADDSLGDFFRRGRLNSHPHS